MIRLPVLCSWIMGGVALMNLFVGCVSLHGNASTASTNALLGEARSPAVPLETRATDYLTVAFANEPQNPGRADLETYNRAAAELTILLRSGDGGRLWDHPLSLTAHGRAFHLRFHPGDTSVWPPNYFSEFQLASSVDARRINHPSVRRGLGGALVGVRSTTPREAFAPIKGIAAPVTATLDFTGHDAVLTLQRPAKSTTALVAGKVRALAADYSAPIAYYRPPSNLFWRDLMGALRSSNYMGNTGLYFLQPYDPARIPVVFIHGLASSSYTWVQTINGLLADPEVRKRYQFWVFNYPTGNPVSYSALRLREELQMVDRLYPKHRDYVLIGHSMGGIIAHMQVVTVTREMWETELGDTARQAFAQITRDNFLSRSLTFRANPRVSRVVFICAPHRGSDLATGGIGRLGRALVALPIAIKSALTDALQGIDLTLFTGASRRLPNSVSGLSPKNPVLKVVNAAKITVPYHSIIGDRGRHDTPQSSDGVVAYWSSHLEGARSELIVPGPHGSAALPETIEELRRILDQHVRSSGHRTMVGRQ